MLSGMVPPGKHFKLVAQCGFPSQFLHGVHPFQGHVLCPRKQPAVVVDFSGLNELAFKVLQRGVHSVSHRFELGPSRRNRVHVSGALFEDIEQQGSGRIVALTP